MDKLSPLPIEDPEYVYDAADMTWPTDIAKARFAFVGDAVFEFQPDGSLARIPESQLDGLDLGGGWHFCATQECD